MVRVIGTWLRRHSGVLLLLMLVLAGLLLAWWHTRDITVLLAWGNRIADHPVAMVAVVVLMAVLFAFALPGFPHSFVNYAAGVLALPRRSFLVAALLGLTIKWGVYATAVYGAVEAIESGDGLQLVTLLPLFALAALLLLGGAARRWMERRTGGA